MVADFVRIQVPNGIPDAVERRLDMLDIGGAERLTTFSS